MADLTNNNSLLSKVIKIGLPIAIQNFVGTALNLIDNMMIGARGESALAAVSLSNKIFFILIITLFGIYSGLGIYSSQYWGKKDIVNIRKIMGISFTLGLSLAVVFFIGTISFPSQLLSLFSQDSAVIEKGVSYLSIASFTYIIVAVEFVFSYTSRSVHRAKFPMLASIIALSINTFLNYLLINGNLGAPQLGVRGAAIATLIARIIELFLLVMLIYKSKDHPLAGQIKDFFSFNTAMFKKVVKTAIPVIINESAWSIGVSIYFIAYGFLGTAAIAAAQVSITISDLIWAFLIGMGNATAVIIGNEIGAERIDCAFSTAKKLLKMEFIASIFLAVCYAVIGYSIVGWFSLSTETARMAVMCIYINAAFIPIRLLGFLYIVGILRSGGDTKFCLILDVSMVWFMGIPLSFFAVLVLKLPIYQVMAVVLTEEIVKVIIAHRRFKSKKWINILIK